MSDAMAQRHGKKRRHQTVKACLQRGNANRTTYTIETTIWQYKKGYQSEEPWKHSLSSWTFISINSPATPPARLLSVIGIARWKARDMFRFLSLLVLFVSMIFSSFLFWCSFFFRRKPSANSQNSLKAKAPKASADKSGGKWGGRLLPRALPPKLANQAPLALQTEIKAFAPNDRLWLEIPTDKPTMKLSVDEARANKKASRKRGMIPSQFAIHCTVNVLWGLFQSHQGWNRWRLLFETQKSENQYGKSTKKWRRKFESDLQRLRMELSCSYDAYLCYILYHTTNPSVCSRLWLDDDSSDFYLTVCDWLMTSAFLVPLQYANHELRNFNGYTIKLLGSMRIHWFLNFSLWRKKREVRSGTWATQLACYCFCVNVQQVYHLPLDTTNIIS